jgi:hypothetical protein
MKKRSSGEYYLSIICWNKWLKTRSKDSCQFWVYWVRMYQEILERGICLGRFTEIWRVQGGELGETAVREG